MQHKRFRAKGTLRAINRYIIIECDKGLGDYYRYLVQLSIGLAHKVGRPMWGYHISVVVSRYETIPANVLELYQQYDGTTIQYWYTNEIQSDGLFFWLPVTCPQAHDVRQNLNLKRNTYYPLHLTFGNLK